MLAKASNIAQARRWQEKKRRLRAAAATEKLRLLLSFGEETRALASTFGRTGSTTHKYTPASVPEVSAAICAILCAWLNLDPTNPEWPGRDRLFLTRRRDLLNSCAALSTCGFFPSEAVVDLVVAVEAEGTKAVIPGVEAPGAPAEDIPRLFWESAAESARDKKRWREVLGAGVHADWFSPVWRDSPETWRSCVVLDAEDEVSAAVRALARREDESAAGMVALVKASEIMSEGVVKEWWDGGWDVILADCGDLVQVYSLLVDLRLERPLAIILSKFSAPNKNSKTVVRRRESGLLGEMPDDIFSELMKESLK